MKTFGTVTLFALAFAGIALADDAAPAKGKSHPCRDIEKSCQDAGFVKGKAKGGKGLFVNCMKPIMNGQKVEGVSVDDSTIQGCKDMRAKHKNKSGGDTKSE